jgi:hypothetical protein
MIINFSDSYINDINIGLTMLGNLQCKLSSHEPFMGNSPYLDKLYIYSILISGIIDHLSYDDNSNPKDNEALLLCLRTLNNKNICGPPCNPLLNVQNIHNLQPYPVQETVFIQQ